MFDFELMLVAMEYFKQTSGLVSAIEWYCGFQMRPRMVCIARLDKGNGIEEAQKFRGECRERIK